MREIINLYDKNETNFNHNGLVVLNDCKSCFITQEINGVYSLELDYPKDQRGKYKYLEGWNIIKADGQLFRIPQLSKVQDNGLNIRIIANHIFYDLLNDFNEDTRADTKTVDEALRIAVLTNPKFNVLASDLTSISNAYFIRENPIISIFQKILPRWGGELYRDNFDIAIKSRIGTDTGILISYGKNLTGFEQTLDYSTVATKIMPIGKDGLTIDLVNQGSKYLESPRIDSYPFVITKVIKFEDIEDATELKNKVLSLWGTIDLPITNYKVDFLELSKTEEYKHLKVLQEVSLGDTVTIRHKEFNVDISARIIKTKKNVLTGRLEEIELGQFRENIAGHINSLEGKINYTHEVIQEVNEDLQGTKTIVFQNQEQISLKAQELQNNINNTKDELEGNIDTANSNISNIDTRLSEAESKITPTAITNTVMQSTEYTQDMTNVNSAITTAQTTANSKATPSYVDGKASAAETNAKAYADSVAQAEADFAEIQAKAYADGKVTAEEQARINDAQAKLDEAKTYADTKAQDAEDAANLYSDSKLNNFVTTIYNAKVIDLQNQIDGNITTWFYDGAPTLSNSPASGWANNATKDIHLGDLYYDNVTGYAYRFVKSGSTYSWGRITDTDVTKALADASKAQDTADKKRRVFVVQPTAPYDIGDLWSQGIAGDLMKCKVAKLQGQSYSTTDWEKASKYTDDTKANEVAGNLIITNGNIDVLVNRVTNAEQKITPEAITQTVTESNTYKSYSLVPNRIKLATTRNSITINPLNAYNFTSGSAIDPNELITVDSCLSDLVYVADFQIANEEVITFDKPADRIETAESKIEQTATSISLVVKEDGTIDGDALAAAINISSSKIEMSALNINLTGVVTFTDLSAEGGTVINGKNIMTNSISFNNLLDKPFIPPQYSDAQALQAWVNSGYKTYIDSTGAYIGNIKANQLLIGGANGSISFNDLINKPFIPSTASDVGAIPSTYINASGIWTGQVYANNINVSNGKITANMIDVDVLYSGINKVSSYVQFGGDLNAIYAVSGSKILTLYSNYGVNIDSNIATVKGETIATRTWVQSQSSIAKFA